MDRFLERKPRETWRPIARSGPKPEKRQTTITSLSGVVSLDEIAALRDDLLGLISAFVGGAQLDANYKMVSLASERAAIRRAKAGDREEQELSADDFGEDDGMSGEEGVASSRTSSKSSARSSTTMAPAHSSRAAGASASSSSASFSLRAHVDAVLTGLESVRISLETLEKTMVGKAVKKLTKLPKEGSDGREWPLAVKARANALIVRWKEVASAGLQRRKRRKASGIDEPVIPHWKKAKLDYHFRGR